MLRIDNLSFGYKTKTQNFSDFSLCFPRGGIYGLLGQNGVGKSTLFYLIMGMLRPSQGEVSYNGAPTLDAKAELMSDMFLIPEEVKLPKVKVSSFIKCIRGFYPKFDDALLERCFKEFGIDARQNVSALSMGNRKKVYISVALASNANLLLMDEPTNGLDIVSKTIFRKLVANHATDDRIIIIATHQVRDVENLIEHVAIIEPNNVIVDADIATVAERLSFCEVEASSLTDDALYSEPSAGGFAAVRENTLGIEGPVDLELLYKASVTYSEKVNHILNR